MSGRSPHQAVQAKQTEVELQNQIHTLRTELNFQANTNARLSKELSECLRKLGIMKLDVVHTDILVGHQTDLSYLAPLFVIYEEQIKNYDKMLENLIEDLRTMESKIQIVNEDNYYLRRQLQEKDQLLLTAYQGGAGGQDNIRNVFNQLERDDLEERLRLMSEENMIYIEKLKKYESSIGDFHSRNEILSRNEQVYVNQIKDLQSQVSQLELEGDNARMRLEVLDNKLKNQIQLVAVADEEKSEYVHRLGKSENENKLLKHQFQHLKQEHENVQNRLNQNKGELQREIDELRQKERENFDRLVHNEREIDNLRDENRGLKKELDQTRSNLEQTIKMMENYENKVTILQKKEENYKQINKQLKDDRESAVMEKERYQLKENQFDQMVQNVQMKHREEVVQLKETFDRQSDQLKSRYKLIIEQRDDEVQRLNEENAQLSIQNERLSKEIKSLKQEVLRMENNLKQDIELNYQQTDDLHRQINEQTEKIQLLEQKILDQDSEYSTLKQQHESQMRAVQNNNADLRQSLEHTRAALTSATQELSTMKSKTSQLGRNNQALIEEVGKTKKHYEQRLEQIQDEYTHKIKTLQLQMEEAMKREKSSRDRSVQLLQQYDQIEEKLKAEYASRTQDLEITIQNLKSMNHQLTLKLQEIKNAAQQMQQEQHHSTIRK